jgi:hypothetical protein
MTAVQVKPIEPPASFTKSNSGFGAEVVGVDPANLTEEQFKE